MCILFSDFCFRYFWFSVSLLLVCNLSENVIVVHKSGESFIICSGFCSWRDLCGSVLLQIRESATSSFLARYVLFKCLSSLLGGIRSSHFVYSYPFLRTVYLSIWHLSFVTFMHLENKSEEWLRTLSNYFGGFLYAVLGSLVVAAAWSIGWWRVDSLTRDLLPPTPKDISPSLLALCASDCATENCMWIIWLLYSLKVL